jgi:hypothetical protein
MANSASFQFLFTPQGLGEAAVHAAFDELVANLGLKRPKPYSSAYSFQSTRPKPALTVELRIPYQHTDATSPVEQQDRALVNIDRFGKAPTKESIQIADAILRRFEVHVGAFRPCNFIDAICESEAGRENKSGYAACAPALLPALCWKPSGQLRPVWIDLWPWTYVSAKFYPTVHDALLRGNYPEVSPAPKGVWVKTGDWTMDGATNLARMKAFWGAFWQQSGLDPARVPGAMGEGLPG